MCEGCRSNKPPEICDDVMFVAPHVALRKMAGAFVHAFCPHCDQELRSQMSYISSTGKLLRTPAYAHMGIDDARRCQILRNLIGS